MKEIGRKLKAERERKRISKIKISLMKLRCARSMTSHISQRPTSPSAAFHFASGCSSPESHISSTPTNESPHSSLSLTPLPVSDLNVLTSSQMSAPSTPLSVPNSSAAPNLTMILSPSKPSVPSSSINNHCPSITVTPDINTLSTFSPPSVLTDHPTPLFTITSPSIGDSSSTTQSSNSSCSPSLWNSLLWNSTKANPASSLSSGRTVPFKKRKLSVKKTATPKAPSVSDISSRKPPVQHSNSTPLLSAVCSDQPEAIGYSFGHVTREQERGLSSFSSSDDRWKMKQTARKSTRPSSIGSCLRRTSLPLSVMDYINSNENRLFDKSTPINSLQNAPVQNSDDSKPVLQRFKSINVGDTESANSSILQPLSPVTASPCQPDTKSIPYKNIRKNTRRKSILTAGSR